MGSRGRRKKDIPIKYNHFNTKLSIIEHCKNCPLRLYANTNDKVTLGIGNIYSGKIMILPNYDSNAKIGYLTILELLEKAYRDITNKDIFEDWYITRGVKCYDNNQYNMITAAFNNQCFIYLQYEIFRLKPLKIIVLDRLCDDWIDSYCNNCIIDKVINPAVLFYDNESLKERFIDELTEAIQ